MLVPLETLPGWPAAEDPSLLSVLGLLVGLPLVVIVVVAVIAKISNMRKVARGEPTHITQPMWVGGMQRPEIEGPRHDEVSDDADDATVAAQEPGSGTGGAGARW